MATSSSSGGIGVTGLLLVAFVVLKLTGFIAWSWWWVLSPFWIPLGLVLAVGGVWIGGILLKGWLGDRRLKKGRK